jgi:NAD(P)-dependent dehydrogenase (short-subunit alcohol dehydrogenase family)
MEKFNNKTVLVTGVTSAIGSEIAKKIIEAKGRVVGTFNRGDTTALLPLTETGSLTLVRWDAMDSPDFIESIELIDAWVHCIGAIDPKPIKYQTKVSTQALFTLNYNSATSVATELMKRNRLNTGGAVVFLSSVSSHHPYRGGSAYAASKAALESFAKALALEWSSRQVRVNTLVCGLVKSPMYEASAAMYTAEEEAKITAKYPLGIGVPSDVALSCLFLLSDEARWITGAQLLLDGGLMLNV